MKTIAQYSSDLLTTEMTDPKTQKNRSFLLGFLDFVILNIAFWGTHWFKYQKFALYEVHKELYVAILVLWLLTSLYWKKLSVVQHESFWTGFKVITKANVGLTMLLSLLIISFRLTAASRLLAYGSCLVFYLLEVIGYLIFYKCWRNAAQLEKAHKAEKPVWEKRSIILLIIDGALWFLSLQIILVLYKAGLFLKKSILTMQYFRVFYGSLFQLLLTSMTY